MPLYVHPAGEACWWTIHPASKQRSEGEKVRVGDDLILVSVSSERYLVSGPTRSRVWWWDQAQANPAFSVDCERSREVT